MIWVVILILFLAFAAYHRLSLMAWSIGLLIGVTLFNFFSEYSPAVKALVWITAFAFLLPLINANAENYLYISLVTWWLFGYSIQTYHKLVPVRVRQLPSNG